MGATIEDPLAHLLGRTERPSSGQRACWEWPGSKDWDGYATWGREAAHRFGLSQMVHRAFYQLMVGPVPAGMDLDHLCRNRGCVNPHHLEAVTHRENVMRGASFAAENRAKTHCPAGHPYDEANTYVYKGHGNTRRCCRACNRLAQKKRGAKS